MSEALLDELYRRIKAGTVRLHLQSQGDGWAHIQIKTVEGYQFEATAHRETVKQGA